MQLHKSLRRSLLYCPGLFFKLRGKVKLKSPALWFPVYTLEPSQRERQVLPGTRFIHLVLLKWKIKEKVLLSEKQLWEYAFPQHKLHVDMTFNSPQKSLWGVVRLAHSNMWEVESLASHSEETNSQHYSFGLVMLKSNWDSDVPTPSNTELLFHHYLLPIPVQLLPDSLNPAIHLQAAEIFQVNTACQSLRFQSPTVVPSPRPPLFLWPLLCLTLPQKSPFLRGYFPEQAETFSFTAYVVREGIKEITTETANNLGIAWKKFLRR